MKAIVVTDQAAGTAGMTLVERPEPEAAGNDVLVEVHGDVAKCETYGVALHRALDARPDGKPRPAHDFQTGFRYVDDFSRRNGEWRIARRICTFEWTLQTEPSAWFDAPPEHRRGGRGGDDPVFWPVLGGPH